MLVEAVFWFHPLVWWIGARLMQERESACDEAVLSLGNEPLDYAEGILTVCKSYLESPLSLVSGVTGADLKKRIHAILTGHIAGDLNLAKKLALAAAALAALTVPIVAGLLCLAIGGWIVSVRSLGKQFNSLTTEPEKAGDDKVPLKN